MSEAAMIWVDHAVDGGPVKGRAYRKAVLSKLAGVSDDDDCAWMTVGDIAERVGCSERKAQYVLRELAEMGLIRETGRTYRKGSRRVPIYELQVDYQAVARVLGDRKARRDAEAQIRGAGPARKPVADGCTPCTHSEDRAGENDDPCTHMGARGCTPNEAIRGEEEADASSGRARAGEVAEGLLDIWPLDALDHTDRAAVFDAVDQIGDEGVNLAALLAAGQAFVAEQGRRKRDFPVLALDRWLSGRRWEARVKRAVAAPATGTARPVERAVWQGPAEIRTAFVSAWGGVGEDRAAAYLDWATWDGEARTITARTGVAFKALTDVGRLCRDLNITIIAPVGAASREG